MTTDNANLFLQRCVCFFVGHTVILTGRHGLLLREWQCVRCGKKFVSHREHGDAMLPTDADSDRIFEDRA